MSIKNLLSRLCKKSKDESSSDAMPKITRYDYACCTATWPPPEWRGEWFNKAMRVTEWLNEVHKTGDVVDQFMNFWGTEPQYNPEHFIGVSLSKIHYSKGSGYTASGGYFDTPYIGKTLEQNCKIYYERILKWLSNLSRNGISLESIKAPSCEEELNILLDIYNIPDYITTNT